MTLSEALGQTKTIFLDTAPVIFQQQEALVDQGNPDLVLSDYLADTRKDRS